MSPRLSLITSLSAILVLAGSLGAQLTLAILPLPSPAANLFIVNVILLAFGVSVVWRNVSGLIAQAVADEQKTEHAWNSAAERIRMGGAS